MNGKLNMENNNILEITEEEKEALEAYKSMGYRDINFFLSSYLENDIAYANLYENKEDLQKNIKKDLEANFDNVKKIYSLMIKNAQKRDITNQKILRGTSEEEIQNMVTEKQITKFLSTTTNRDTMMNFGFDAKNPAFLEIQTNGKIPFVKVKDVLGYETAQEDEIIFSPFVHIKSMQENGVYRTTNMKNENIEINKYKATIEKQDLSQVDVEEKQNIKMQIESQISEISNELYEVAQNRGKYLDLQAKQETVEINIARIETKLDKTENELDDLEWYYEENEKIKQEKESIQLKESAFYEKIKKWKQGIIEYTKIECREVEKDIQEQLQQKEIQASKNKTQYLLNNLDKDFSDVRNKVNIIEEKDRKYKKISELLGTNYEITNLKCTNEQLENLKNSLEKLNNIEQNINTTQERKQYDEYLYSIEKIIMDNTSALPNMLNELDNKLKRLNIYQN